MGGRGREKENNYVGPTELVHLSAHSGKARAHPQSAAMSLRWAKFGGRVLRGTALVEKLLG